MPGELPVVESLARPGSTHTSGAPLSAPRTRLETLGRVRDYARARLASAVARCCLRTIYRHEAGGNLPPRDARRSCVESNVARVAGQLVRRPPRSVAVSRPRGRNWPAQSRSQSAAVPRWRSLTAMRCPGQLGPACGTGTSSSAPMTHDAPFTSTMTASSRSLASQARPSARAHLPRDGSPEAFSQCAWTQASALKLLETLLNRDQRQLTQACRLS